MSVLSALTFSTQSFLYLNSWVQKGGLLVSSICVYYVNAVCLLCKCRVSIMQIRFSMLVLNEPLHVFPIAPFFLGPPFLPNWKIWKDTLKLRDPLLPLPNWENMG